MDIDWSFFTIGADHDGSLDIEHGEDACRWTLYLNRSSFTIAELMKLAEEHLKTCPAWTGEPA